MISNLFKSLRLTIAFCLFFSVFYIFVLWLFAQVAGPNKGNAELVTLNGKVVGAANVGQNFTQDIYFWGRPSHAGDGYDASSSAGSNKGPSNEEHLALLEERIDTFLVHHPYLTREKVPAEIITASSSGLDPHISPEAAKVQLPIVAAASGLSEEEVQNIVDNNTEKKVFGIFGEEEVNVLECNIDIAEAMGE